MLMKFQFCIFSLFNSSSISMEFFGSSSTPGLFASVSSSSYSSSGPKPGFSHVAIESGRVRGCPSSGPGQLRLPEKNLAARKLLVAAEAAEHGQGVVCALLDNDKCFEHREREQAVAVIATARVVQRADLLAEVVPHELGKASAITATSWSPETWFFTSCLAERLKRKRKREEEEEGKGEEEGGEGYVGQLVLLAPAARQLNLFLKSQCLFF